MDKCDSFTSERIRLVPISLLCLTFPIVAINHLCHEKQVSAALPLAVYFAYTVGVGTILAMIAHRLYVMHEVRRFVFDIATWFMLVGLVALPIGTSSMLASWIPSVVPTVVANRDQTWTGMVAAGLYLLIIPMFFVTEATMALAVVVARAVRRRPCHASESRSGGIR